MTLQTVLHCIMQDKRVIVNFTDSKGKVLYASSQRNALHMLEYGIEDRAELQAKVTDMKFRDLDGQIVIYAQRIQS